LKSKIKLVTVVIVLCIVLGGIFYPFELTDVPAWRIRVVDQTGKPVSGVVLRQYWKNYTLATEAGENTEEKQSDMNGYVQFEQRSTKASVAQRLLRGSLRFIAQLSHGSVGVSSRVVVLESLTTLNYEPGQPLPQAVKVFRVR
jgi:hypothetical protein